MKIKAPAVYDISHYETVTNYAAISPRPAMLIVKASEGATFRDGLFVQHMNGAAQLGAVRGAYHFHRKAVATATQVKNFCDTIRPIVTKRDVLILDVEEGGETAAQLKAWYEGVMAQFPDNPYWIYSRKNLLDPIAMVLGIFSTTAMEARIERENPLNAIQMTLAERDFFRTRLQATWTAGYPVDPDLYDSVPSFYVPDQTKWPPARAWQYSDKGAVTGIVGDVDLNWMDGTYLASLGGAVTPPAVDDIVTQPFAGVKRVTGVRYGRPFSLVIADPKQVRYEVRHVDGGDQRNIPSNIAKATGAQFVWNGGDWDKNVYPYLPKDLAISNGVTRVSRKTARPSLIFQKDGTPSISHSNVSGQWNVTTGVRYIIQNGALPSYLSGTEVQYTDLTARSVEGLDKNGHVMRLTIDGENVNNAVRYGVTLKEAALLMVEYGCNTAFDTGGGGDTCEIMNGQLMNVPEDISNGQHVERNVPEFLVLYAQENENMANYFEYKATGNRAIRTGPGVSFPRIASNSDFLLNTVAKGGAEPADRHVLPADLYSGATKIGAAGDVWGKVYDNAGKSVDGWTAKTHLGVAQVTEKLVTVTPPPVVEPFVVTLTVKSSGYSDETVTVTMTPL